MIERVSASNRKFKGEEFEFDRAHERKSFVIYFRFEKIQCTSNSYKYEEFAATIILEIIKAAILCVRTVIFFGVSQSL